MLTSGKRHFYFHSHENLMFSYAILHKSFPIIMTALTNFETYRESEVKILWAISDRSRSTD